MYLLPHRLQFCHSLAFGLWTALASIWAVADNGELYAQLLADAEALAAHNELVSRQLEVQTEQIRKLQAEISALDETAAALEPLLLRMQAALQEFVAQDLPFVDPVSDRGSRLARLQSQMSDPAISQAERYRRLLEAYQIELDYGLRLETYHGQLDDGREAEFVRVGRITLLYQTANGDEVGYWDRTARQWVVDKSYRRAIATALRIASKELAPDLIAVPVPAPREVGTW